MEQQVTKHVKISSLRVHPREVQISYRFAHFFRPIFHSLKMHNATRVIYLQYGFMMSTHILDDVQNSRSLENLQINSWYVLPVEVRVVYCFYTDYNLLSIIIMPLVSGLSIPWHDCVSWPLWANMPSSGHKYITVVFFFLFFCRTKLV